jgi:hypothetical protein
MRRRSARVLLARSPPVFWPAASMRVAEHHLEPGAAERLDARLVDVLDGRQCAFAALLARERERTGSGCRMPTLTGWGCAPPTSGKARAEAAALPCCRKRRRLSRDGCELMWDSSGVDGGRKDRM